MAFAPALDQLASLLHRIAVAQIVDGSTESMQDGVRVADYAARMSPESVQLAYQICVQGRADLALAPDEAAGFVMTMLRMLAFEPARDDAIAKPAGGAPQRTDKPPEATPQRTDKPRVNIVSRVDTAAHEPAPAIGTPSLRTLRALPQSATEWPAFIAELALNGIAGQLAAQTALIRVEGSDLLLGLPEAQRHLTDKSYVEKLKSAIEDATGGKVRLKLELRPDVDVSLAAQDKRERALQKAKDESAFREEPFVRDVVARFDARIKPDSIKPVS
jgi:DNA polymerase-3 subunit gamma/tau